MSTYKSEFCSINGDEYQIKIITSNGKNDTKTFTLGGSPFTTEMDSDGKTIYAPIKTTGATITMRTKNLPFDIYSGSVHGTKVVVNQGDNVIYTGYVEPCAYSQNFDKEVEDLEIDCVDGIASLKDIVYTRTGDIITFKDLICSCLSKCDCYKYLYVSDNVLFDDQSGVRRNKVIEKFRISEQNFFDEKKDVNQTDDDVAWSCYDVLYEVCQYLGYTLFADGENVYIIDYDQIKYFGTLNKVPVYYKYSLQKSNLGAPVGNSSIQKGYIYNIGEGKYSGNGSKVSLDEVYNKVSVEDKFYTYDNLFPDFDDKDNQVNITTSSKTDIRYLTTNSDVKDHYVLVDTIVKNVDYGIPENYQIMICKSWRNVMYVLICKFYTNNIFEYHKYNPTTKKDITSTLKEGSFEQMVKYHGAWYIKYYTKEISSSQYNSWRANYPSNWDSLTDIQKQDAYSQLLNQNDPSKIQLSPIIVCTNLPTNHIGPGDGTNNRTDNELCRKYPYITLKGEQSSSIFGGEGSYVIISGSLRYHDEWKSPYPLKDDNAYDKLKYEGDYKLPEECFTWARLKWGEQYWNGITWTTTPTDFKLRWFDPDFDVMKDNANKEKLQNKTIYNRDMDFLDTASSMYGYSDKGQYIPCPESGNLTGNAELVIYANRDMWGKSNHSGKNIGYGRYYSFINVLKSFKVKAQISNGFLDDKDNDSDTVYTNVITSDAVKKMESIEFKICTFDKKKPTYSSVEYLNNKGESVYLTKTVNRMLMNEESGSISSFDGKTGLTQEEHLIFKLVKQYKEPRVIFEVNLHNDRDYTPFELTNFENETPHHTMYGLYTDTTLSGKYFIPTEINIDYRYNSVSVKLTEKA